MAKYLQRPPKRPIALFSLLNKIPLIAIMVSPSMAQKACFCLAAVFKKLILAFFH